MKHELKIKPEYFAAIYLGEKTFEIRNNADRNFQVGDTLLLKAWDGEFTGDFVEKVVSYITDFEQKPGYVVLGLVNHREREMELAAQLSDATRQCGLMADLVNRMVTMMVMAGDEAESRSCNPVKAWMFEAQEALAGKLHICQSVSPLLDRIGLLTFLLRELRDGVEGEWCFPGNLDERIDAALAGKLPDQQLDMVSLSDIASLQRYTLGGHCDSFGQDCGAEMERDEEGEYILLAESMATSSLNRG